MSNADFKIDSLNACADTVARVVPADKVFSILSRSVAVPTGWVVMATREDRDPLIAREGTRCDGRGVMDLLFVRSTPITCEAQAHTLRSKDGYDCRGSIRVAVKVLTEPAELVAFRKVALGARASASVSDIHALFARPLGEALASLASRHTVDDLLTALDPSAVRALTDEMIGAVCLTSGTIIDGQPDVRFDSSDYTEHRRVQTRAARQEERVAARSRIQEALAAAQRDRLGHLADMLAQMQRVSERHGDLSLGDLLRTFSEEERGPLYDALWRGTDAPDSSETTRFIAAVSGQELLFFTPPELREPARRIELPDALGALRSVSVDRAALEAGVVLVGAAAGVHLVEIERGAMRCSLPAGVDQPDKLRGGVNAAAMSEDRVFATHSELGVLGWPVAAPPGTTACRLWEDLTTGADAVRSSHVAEGHLWFTADETLWSARLPLDSEACRDALEAADPAARSLIAYRGSRAALSKVVIENGAIYAGNIDGQIITWEVGEPGSGRIIRGTADGPVESIHVVHAGGIPRLIVADRGHALLAMVVGDSYVCRYESPSHRIRRAAAAADVLVAMNDLRDRLIAWDPREPSAPNADVIIPYLTGHRVQDLCLVLQA